MNLSKEYKTGDKKINEDNYVINKYCRIFVALVVVTATPSALLQWGKYKNPPLIEGSLYFFFLSLAALFLAFLLCVNSTPNSVSLALLVTSAWDGLVLFLRFATMFPPFISNRLCSYSEYILPQFYNYINDIEKVRNKCWD